MQEIIVTNLTAIVGVIVGLLGGLSGLIIAIATARKYRADRIKTNAEGAASGKKAGAAVAAELMQEQTARVNALRDDVRYAEERNTKLETKLRDALTRIDASEEIERAANEALQDAERRVAKNLVRLSKTETDLAEVHAEIGLLRKTSSERIAELVTENAKLRSELAALKETYATSKLEWETERVELKQKIAELTEIVNAIQSAAKICAS